MNLRDIDEERKIALRALYDLTIQHKDFYYTSGPVQIKVWRNIEEKDLGKVRREHIPSLMNYWVGKGLVNEVIINTREYTSNKYVWYAWQANLKKKKTILQIIGGE